MGDRANIVIKSDGEQVCLYTHWGGSSIEGALCKALVRGKSRWDDFQYLTRIIFCEMIKGDGFDELTGFGISQDVHDGAHRVITVDVDQRTVRVFGDEPIHFISFINMLEGEM